MVWSASSIHKQLAAEQKARLSMVQVLVSGSIENLFVLSQLAWNLDQAGTKNGARYQVQSLMDKQKKS